MDYAAKLIFVPTYAADGTRNKIANDAIFTQVTMQALIDQADATKRWYPTPLLENVMSERAESTYETGSTGRRYKTKKGVRSYSFDIMNQWGLYQAVFEQFECAEMSFFIVDANGGLIGLDAATDDGYRYPIRISKDSMDATLVTPEPDKTVKIHVSFEFDEREKDSLLRIMEYTSTVMTANPLEAEGLNAVYSTMISNTTTAAVVDLYAVHNGGTLKKVPITGLVVTDFYDVRGGASSKAYNVTDSSAIALSSVSESSTIPGRYTLTYGAQTSGTLASADVVRITPVKTQLDFTAVVSATMVVS
jgi:hypothetical protein